MHFCILKKLTYIHLFMPNFETYNKKTYCRTFTNRMHIIREGERGKYIELRNNIKGAIENTDTRRKIKIEFLKIT